MNNYESLIRCIYTTQGGETCARLLQKNRIYSLIAFEIAIIASSRTKRPNTRRVSFLQWCLRNMQRERLDLRCLVSILSIVSWIFTPYPACISILHVTCNQRAFRREGYSRSNPPPLRSTMNKISPSFFPSWGSRRLAGASALANPRRKRDGRIRKGGES